MLHGVDKPIRHLARPLLPLPLRTFYPSTCFDAPLPPTVSLALAGESCRYGRAVQHSSNYRHHPSIRGYPLVDRGISPLPPPAPKISFRRSGGVVVPSFSDMMPLDLGYILDNAPSFPGGGGGECRAHLLGFGHHCNLEFAFSSMCFRIRSSLDHGDKHSTLSPRADNDHNNTSHGLLHYLTLSL